MPFVFSACSSILSSENSLVPCLYDPQDQARTNPSPACHWKKLCKQVRLFLCSFHIIALQINYMAKSSFRVSFCRQGTLSGSSCDAAASYLASQKVPMVTILVGKGLGNQSKISLEDLTLVKELGALKLP